MVAPVGHRAERTPRGALPAQGRTIVPDPTGPGHRSDGPSTTGWVAPLVGQAAVLLAGTNFYLTHYVSVADVLAVALAPLWLGLLRHYRGAVPFFLLVPLTVASGYVTAVFRAVDHPVSREIGEIQLSALLTGVAVVAVLLWARDVLPWWRVALGFGVGDLVGAVSAGGAFGVDGFKYHLAVPLTVIVLSLTHRWGNHVVSAAAALVLGGVGIVNDARSYMGFCVLAAVLALWQAARASSRRRMRRLSPLFILAALGAGSYVLLSDLLVGGYLGAQLQAKSVAQINAAGSLIAGGRPEWSATFQLMAHTPLGFGLGIRPSWWDILVAKSGLQSVGLPIENNGYIDHYMFGTGFNLHSVAAELWANYGVVGALFAVAVLVLLLANLTRALADRRAGALVVFLAVGAVWDLAFGPLYTNWSDICLALGLVLATRTHQPLRPAPLPLAADPDGDRPSRVTVP